MLSKRKIALCFAATAGYAALALWAKASYVDPAPKGTIIIQLHRPYTEQNGAWRSFLFLEDAAKLTGLNDVMIYEDGKPAADIGNIVREWDGTLISFASGRADPNHNGHLYWAAVP
jgi:hypothetical protein